MIVCNLAVLMAERGLNIQDVSNSTKLSRTTVSTLVNNNGKGIQFDTMDELCELLNIAPGDLFSRFVVEQDYVVESITIDSEEEDTYIITERDETDLEPYISALACTIELFAKVSINGDVIVDNLVLFKVNVNLNQAKEIHRISVSTNKDTNFIKNRNKAVSSLLEEKITEALLDELEQLEEIEGTTSLTIYWN